MNRLTKTLALAGAASCLLASNAFAGSMVLSEAQMDTVSGGAFVCPVISTDAVLNAAGGVTAVQIADNSDGSAAYSIAGPTVSVPDLATNDNGAGSPGGSHASPGDTTYTAIWGG